MPARNLETYALPVALAAVLVALGAGWAPARTPTSPAGELEAGSVCSSAHGVQTLQDGVLAGLGPDYEIRFHDHGIEFTPALGRTAPANRPLHLVVESMHRGAALIPVVAAARATASGNVVEYERGAGPYRVVERYETRLDGVEQSFVFDDLPKSAGDLVVRVRVDTELLPERTGTFTDGLLLSETGVGGIRIGGVTAIDAAGARVAGMIRFDGAYLELVVPGSFVDRSALPLVLDPLIGTDFTVGGVANEYRPDVAYDATNDLYLVVWERHFSSSDSRIMAQRVHSKGYLVGKPLSFTSQTYAAVPKVGNVNSRDRFLVVWPESPVMFGDCDLKACSVDAATGAVSKVITIAGGPGHQVFAGVGGEATLVGDCAMVIWTESDTQIHGARVQLPPAGDPKVVAPGVIPISSTGSWSDRVGTISHSAATGNFLVVWRREFGTQELLRGRVIDRNGKLLTKTSGVTSSGTGITGLSVAGNGSEWVVVYSMPESVAASESDLFYRQVKYDAGLGLLVSYPESVLADASKNDERDPTVAYAGSKYLAAWVQEGATGSPTVSYTELDPTGCMPCLKVNTFPSLNEGHLAPEIATKLSGDTKAGDEGLLVWHHQNSAVSLDWKIQAQKIEAIGDGGPVVDLAGGCGNGGKLVANGAAAIGNPDFELVFKGVLTAQKSVIMNLAVPGKAIGCGKCQIVPIQFLITIPLKGGQAVLPLPIPCVPQFAGAAVQVQFITPSSGTTPCPSLDGVSFSNGVQFTLGF